MGFPPRIFCVTARPPRVHNRPARSSFPPDLPMPAGRSLLALALLALLCPAARAQEPAPLGPVASPGWGEGVAFARLPVGETGERPLLFLADIVAGLRIYDVTDPAEPALLSSLLPGGVTCPSGFYSDNVRVLGTRAYLAGGRCGVLVVDVSDPTAPQIALRVSTPSYAKDALPRDVPGGSASCSAPRRGSPGRRRLSTSTRRAGSSSSRRRSASSR